MKAITQEQLSKLEENGFLQIDAFLSSKELASLQKIEEKKNVRFCNEKIAACKMVSNKVQEILSLHFPHLQLNRSIFFNKNSQNNWSVLWHQDLTLSVKEKMHINGYGPWSVKEGIPHVQPSLEVLESMITVRVLIDDCSDDNGPLKLISESHLKGILEQKEIALEVKKNSRHHCTGEAGSILLMKPLILHSSEKSKAMNLSRRVLHLEYLTKRLKNKLQLYHS